VSLSAWVRVGWLALAADFLYWRLGGSGPLDDNEGSVPQWHSILNAVLWYGGALLFVVLLVVSYLLWRANERERTQT
jgi:D-alanyl-lipoteichoic acid acyltransferase DltB (MBOAT superfamily)